LQREQHTGATIRPYVDDDWQAVLEICLLAFTPIHESFEGLLEGELFRLVYPDWRASNERYLRSLSEGREKEKLFVAEDNAVVVGFIHYSVDPESQSGKIGLNAVHPAHQSKGIGALMYSHVLDIMRTAGMKYAQVGTGGDVSHAPARRAYEKLGFVPIPVAHYYKKL
jgi:GNAT superfamily N-acetyltransferase